MNSKQRTLYDLLVEPREQVDAALQRARTQPPFVLTARRPNREERIIEGTVHLLDEYALLHFSFADLTDLHLSRRALRETSAISPRHTGYAYLRELVCAISRTFDGAHTYIGRLVEAQRVRGIAYAIETGELHEPIRLSPARYPMRKCGRCQRDSAPTRPGVQELFPRTTQALRATGCRELHRRATARPLGARHRYRMDCAHEAPPASDAVREIFQLFTTRAAHELLREQTEAEAEQLRAQLLQVQKMESIGRMAGGLAHDFNNLLTAVLGYIELAQGALPPNNSAQGFLNNAITAVEKAAGVTRQLMTLARQQPMQRRMP
jgi:signal transduction histidine kinase